MTATGLQRLLAACLPLLVLAATPAAAADYKISGYSDFRLVYPSDTEGFLIGGLGKTRWGSNGQASLQPELGSVVLRGDAQPIPALHAVIELRYDTQQKTALDILDAFARVRELPDAGAAELGLDEVYA